MNAPVTRLSVYGSATTGELVRSVTLPMSLTRERGRLDLALERLRIGALADHLNRRAHSAAGVLERIAPADVQRVLAHPADRAVELPRGRRLIRGRHQHVASADVELIGQAQRHRHRRHGLLRLGVERVDLGDRRRHPGREHDDLVAGLQRAGHDSPRIEPRVGVARPADPLDRNPQAVEIAIGLHVDLFEVLEQRGALVERRVLGAKRDVVAVQRADRDDEQILDPQPANRGPVPAGRSRQSARDPSRRGPSC